MKLKKAYMIKIFNWYNGEPVCIYRDSVYHMPSENQLLNLLEKTTKNIDKADLEPTIVTEFYEVVSGT